MAVKENKLGLILVGLLLVVAASAMDQTIVASSLGTIVADIGGLDKFVWVTSSYLVAEMAVMPIFGKLSDMYGRKQFFLFGVLLFLLGSVLCSAADSIATLSLFRAIQGIGGGAMLPLSMSIVLNAFPVEKRGKMVGVIGAVFGLSTIIGPLLGSFITDYLSWHWLFFINVPIGLISVVLITCFYHESHVRSKHKIDWWGAITLVLSVVSLMFALQLGGQQFAWDSLYILVLFLAFVIFFVLFIIAEKNAEEPIISFQMFSSRAFAIGNILMVLYGVIFVVPIMFIPIFVQGVFGGTTTNSGLVLFPMVIGLSVSSILGGVIVSKFSYRSIMILSGFLLLPSVYLLGSLSVDTPRLMLTFIMILTGLGIGFSFSVLYLAAVHNVNPTQHGVINSTLNFTREFGMVIGITIYGVLQNHAISKRLASANSSISDMKVSDLNLMLTPESRQRIPEKALQGLTDVMSSSIANTFMWILIPTGIAFITIFFMERGLKVEPPQQEQQGELSVEK